MGLLSPVQKSHALNKPSQPNGITGVNLVWPKGLFQLMSMLDTQLLNKCLLREYMNEKNYL